MLPKRDDKDNKNKRNSAPPGLVWTKTTTQGLNLKMKQLLVQETEKKESTAKETKEKLKPDSKEDPTQEITAKMQTLSMEAAVRKKEDPIPKSPKVKELSTQKSPNRKEPSTQESSVTLKELDKLENLIKLKKVILEDELGKTEKDIERTNQDIQKLEARKPEITQVMPIDISLKKEKRHSAPSSSIKKGQIIQETSSVQDLGIEGAKEKIKPSSKEEYPSRKQELKVKDLSTLNSETRLKELYEVRSSLELMKETLERKLIEIKQKILQVQKAKEDLKAQMELDGHRNDLHLQFFLRYEKELKESSSVPKQAGDPVTPRPNSKEMGSVPKQTGDLVTPRPSSKEMGSVPKGVVNARLRTFEGGSPKMERRATTSTTTTTTTTSAYSPTTGRKKI